MHPVLVIGAGPAGLATGACLTRRGIAFRLLERGPTLGHSWESLYDSLVLHTGRHMSTLPGRRYPSGTSLYPSRQEFLDYLRDYAKAFDLEVECDKDVHALRRSSHGWAAALEDGRRIEGSSAVVCTGIIPNPRLPEIAGREHFRGTLLHASDYRRPDAFVGKRVLVVGVGNSGGEIGSELARAAAHVTMLVRTGAHVVPLSIAGVPIQYLSSLVRQLPRPAQEFVVRRVAQLTDARRGPPVLPRPPYSPLDAIPVIGFRLVDAIKEGLATMRRGEIVRLTEDGATFTDGESGRFDAIILATGYAPALGMLGSLVTRDARGFATRRDRVTSAEQSGLYFVGHNYDATGGIANIARDARLVARHISDCRAEGARLARRREIAKREVFTH
jgi:cation diffusion facilitator CzcD-associated flavoprotein CzcO